MSFLIVLIGVIVDRLMPTLSEQRSEAWFHASYRELYRRLPHDRAWPGLLLAAVAVLVPALVTWAAVWLVYQLVPLFAYVLGLVVFIFMLGPRGLFAELQAYRNAVAHGNDGEVSRLAAELLAPLPVPAEPQVRTRAVISRLLVLAGRRLFGVIFWYVLLGPAGAVMFRAADILRHHADVDSEAARAASRQLYGVLEWAPSRILAGTYALAGSFDDAMAERHACYAESSGHFFEMNEDILACTGRGALAFAEQLSETGELDALNNLLFRSLVIWLAVLALLSLIGWT